MSEIGFLGLGIMGSGMVRNLLKAGHGVTAWNRTARDLPADLSGARIVSTIAEAAKGRKTVVVSLTGPDAQRDVLLGDDGLFAVAEAGAAVVDTTTTDPVLAAELAGQAQGRGLRYLDAPVFGSRNEAWEGRLDFVCGGERATFDAVKPVLDCMAATVHHLGSSGKGAAAKLVGNLLVAAQMVSLGEALCMARKAGLEADTLMSYLDVTDFSSGLIRGVGRATLSGDFEPNFYLRHMLKDARLIGTYARGLGVAAPASGMAAELYQAALNKGYGELNASALHKLQFELSGVEVK
ncbi:NAD(P)-dependent oxidoreductase [Mesorhizobium sp. PUT5]|uniref:NAD(P)-dependent oxidoreductase n=1 Tax=Mesorhizobium sp. PUT5 TaxID=3454629 RepID=UPI003FA4BB1C